MTHEGITLVPTPILKRYSFLERLATSIRLHIENTKNRNLCMKELSCQASCCHDIFLVVSKESFIDFFSGLNIPLKKLPPDELEQASEKPYEKGVYFSDTDNGFFIQLLINGPCPHLGLQSFNCMIYERRPPACQSFLFRGKECQYIRLRDKTGLTIALTPKR